MTQDSPHIAVIGLGAMGLPMATHLATAFSVTGFDPYPPRREPAAEEAGLTVCSTPAAACAERRHRPARGPGPCPGRGRALRAGRGDSRPSKPGSPVILTSTVGPDAARELADQLASAGYSAGRRADQRRSGPCRER